VRLVDRHNYHTFFPLLYQVGAAELEPEDIAYPVRSLFRGRGNVRFTLAEMRKVDLERRLVECNGEAMPYDYLVLATGSIPHFFGAAGAAEHAFPLRSLEQGIALRNQVLSCFERAVREPDRMQRRGLLTFAIVGGGPTGVEFAGALAELVYGPLRRDYPSLDFGEVRVLLLEASDRLLSALPGPLGAYALRRLRGMTVQVHLKTTVERVTADALFLKGGEAVSTKTVVWTAGVRGDPDVEQRGLLTNSRGQVKVLPTLQVPDHPEAYVVGDLASVEGGPPLPMVAPVAMQQGEWAARNILRQIAGRPPAPFRYSDRGMMAVVGRNAAVAHLFGRWPVTGFPAWVLWLALHLVKLIGFRNRLVALSGWAWDYLFYERVVRLILPRRPPL
jgi:NADH dehydrogenase